MKTRLYSFLLVALLISALVPMARHIHLGLSAVRSMDRAVANLSSTAGGDVTVASEPASVPPAPALQTSPAGSAAVTPVNSAPATSVKRTYATLQPGAAVAPIRDEDVDYSRQYVLVRGQRAHPTRLLARFKSETSDDTRAAALHSRQLAVRRDYSLTSGSVLLDVTSNQVPSVANAEEAAQRGEELLNTIEALQTSGQFDYVEPDYLVSSQTTPGDSSFVNGALWALRNTGQSNGVAGADIAAVAAWDITTGSSNVIVAVIDSGIRYTHQDLAPQMWRNAGEIAANGLDDDGDGYVDNVFGIDAVTGSGNPSDDAGHGTHTAGTIGAIANGGGAHVGVCWQVRLMACRFMKYNASLGGATGTTSDAIECINFAVSKGAKVLNNSWGGGSYSISLYNAIAAARDAGVLFVAAAGNGGSDGLGDNNDSVPSYPANYPLENVVSVAATDRQDKLGSFSNFGANTVHLAAPGVSIYSTWKSSDTSYTTASGTSMAAPHVCGVAALVLAQFPDCSMSELRLRLLLGTDPIVSMRGKCTTGGRLNARNSLTLAPDGELEVAIRPASGSQISGGSSVLMSVEVTDLLPITNADVTVSVVGAPVSSLVADTRRLISIPGSALYTAQVALPTDTNQVTFRVVVATPGRSTVTNLVAYTILVNDNFSNSQMLTGVATSINADTHGATKETGEPLHAGFLGGKSLWWSWTAPANGSVTIDTIGSAFDTLLAVYTGNTVSGLVSVASDDQSGGLNTSKLTFTAAAGQTYRIAVDGYSAGSGPLKLSLRHAASQPIVLQLQRLPSGTAKLSFRRADGSLPSDLSRIELQWRNTLPGGADTNWQKVMAGFSVADGYVVCNDTSAATQPARFYRVLER